MNSAALDLDLDKLRDALIAERAVTAAGQRVGLSQPATKNGLRRPRAPLGEPPSLRDPCRPELTPCGPVLPEPSGRPRVTSQLLWARRNARHPPLVWLRDAVRRAVTAQGDASR